MSAQEQIDWLNKNLKKEIDLRLGDGDRYRYAIAMVDARVIKIERRLGVAIFLLAIVLVTTIVVLCGLDNDTRILLKQKCGT